MLEHRRQQYLSLLGIENYMPTRILPSAAPSLLLPDELLLDPAALPLTAPNQVINLVDDADDIVARDAMTDNASVEAETHTHSTVERLVADVAINVGGPLDALGGGLKRELATPVPNNPVSDHATLPPQDDSHTLAPIKFIFSVWRVKDMLILDTRKVREALPTDRLLQNILLAVGYPTVQLPVSESLRWPLFVDKRGGQALSAEDYNSDKEQARAMVQAYVSAQDTKAPLKHLLLMGEEAATFALDDTLDVENTMGSMHTIKDWEHINCFVMPSLYSMLQDPPSKRIAWSALQLMPMVSE